MKKLFVIFVMLVAVNTSGQWQPDVRLTNKSTLSWTSDNNAWCVAASGTIVHVVWYDNRNGNYEIYYKRSTDAGVSWGLDTRLTNNTAQSMRPSVSVSNSVVHVVWYDERDGNNEIYYKRSTDSGVSWGVDTRLTNNISDALYPSISVSDSVVHVVWEDNRSGGYSIYHKRSTDEGVNWEADTRLATNNNSWTEYPSVTASGSVVHIVWEDNRDGNYEIYYKRSSDAGVSWGLDTRLTNNSAVSMRPSVSVSNSVVHVAWQDTRDGNEELYYKHSTDGGLNWAADTRLTNDISSTRKPSIAVSGSVVHIVWYDYRDALSPEIYYKRSTDTGINWETDIRLTNNPYASYYPFVAVSGSVVHVVWIDERDGTIEIYYKRDPSGNVTEVRDIDLELLREFSLSQNYPNPFNPSTLISYQLPVSSEVILKVYDILGNEVATLVNEKKSAGSYEVEFKSTTGSRQLASGIYYYQLKSGDYIQTKKMILMK